MHFVLEFTFLDRNEFLKNQKEWIIWWDEIDSNLFKDIYKKEYFTANGLNWISGEVGQKFFKLVISNIEDCSNQGERKLKLQITNENSSNSGYKVFFINLVFEYSGKKLQKKIKGLFPFSNTVLASIFRIFEGINVIQ